LDADGNTVAHSLDNPNQPDIIALNDEPNMVSAVSRKRDPAHLEERCCTPPGAYCWNYGLDHGGCDQSVRDLISYVDNWVNDLVCTAGDFISHGSVENGVIAYICLDIPSPPTCEGFNSDDVRLAMAKMDAACPLYQAGYFRFDTGEQTGPKVIGRCSSGDHFCY